MRKGENNRVIVVTTIGCHSNGAVIGWRAGRLWRHTQPRSWLGYALLSAGLSYVPSPRYVGGISLVFFLSFFATLDLRMEGYMVAFSISDITTGISHLSSTRNLRKQEISNFQGYVPLAQVASLIIGDHRFEFLNDGQRALFLIK